MTSGDPAAPPPCLLALPASEERRSNTYLGYLRYRTVQWYLLWFQRSSSGTPGSLLPPMFRVSLPVLALACFGSPW